MTLCRGCAIDPRTGRCQFGGPFKIVPAKKPDVPAYIGQAYGEALAPKFINGQWHSDYQPFGPIFDSWEAYRQYLACPRSPAGRGTQRQR